MHIMYGAVDIEGTTYRVKVTLKEDRSNGRPTGAYSYETTKIELLAGQDGQAVTSPRNSNNSISGVKLLENVESSKYPGKKLLDHSKILDENGEPLIVYHQTNRKIYINKETGQNWDTLDWKEKEKWNDRDDWDDVWEEKDFYTFDNRYAS